MGKKLGGLIRTARTDAGMTQEQLAKKVSELSASELSKVERGEKEPTTDQLKQIAKATGVTQKSLLEAAKPAKTASSGKSAASSKDTMKVSAAERKLVELYRQADADTRKAALKTLQGEKPDFSPEGLLGAAIDVLMKK